MRLTAELEAAEAEGLARRGVQQAEATANGIYVVFESFAGLELALESLDPRQGQLHPELVAVREVSINGETYEQATVWVPDGKLGYFLKRLNDYANTADEESPKSRNLIDRIRSVGLASLEQLWTDPPEEFPQHEETTWWEVWLRRQDGDEIERLRAFAAGVGGELGRTRLGFADRTVALVKATADQLSNALDLLDDLAELRRPRQPAALLARESPIDQADWIDQLAQRTTPAPANAVAACVLDTGVFRDHPLLSGSLTADDCHTCDPAWNVADHDGHGTQMAGLALFGDLGEAVLAADEIRLRHRLESVKLLPPPPGVNPPELYGAVTATATSQVEIQQPERPRVFSMAVTADWQEPGDAASPGFGRPTSWSAAIDALSAGLSIDVTADGLTFLDEAELAVRRLFLISTGNVIVEDEDHLTRSDLEPVEDPAQAWNALTVGAHTELVSLDEAPDFVGWTPVAVQGELSPFSRTSVPFERAWPSKPDVVLEGGNVARSPDGTQLDTPDVFQILTTDAPLQNQRLLTTINATSAATAQAAHLGASILADDPTLWPETVRALIVHSAEWTDVMAAQFQGAPSREQRWALRRRYGMGVPDLSRATRSATDALTLVAQDVIHPFDGQGRMREMHLHDLPWPVDVLAALGHAEARMRVTLSYFIEPNPGRRGWVRRYSYASHGLRFAVRRPTETTDDFRKRINQRALLEDEARPVTESDAPEWFFGTDYRVTGSLHTDTWTGTAADLAHRGALAVFPVTGWWKERKDRDHSERGARYALVVSIETPTQEVDLWTPVAQQVAIPIEIDG